ncbi:MAG: hypothetical protein WCP46_07700, partial [Alphaproteobacteria bacterium]
MKTYIILLLLGFCNLGHTADIRDLPSGIGNLKETKERHVPVQTALQPLVETGEILEFEVVHRLPSAFSPDIRRICIEFCGTDVLSLASVCKDWANSVIHYTNGAKKAHQHLASVGLKLPGGKFFDLYLNNDSTLNSGGFTSSALRVFVTKRYREISKGIEMPETQFREVSGNFAQRLVTASRTLDALPAMITEINLLNEVHSKLGGCALEGLRDDFSRFAGIESVDLFRMPTYFFNILQSTKLSSALGNEVDALTESQTVCYELMKALKCYLVFVKRSDSFPDSYWQHY